MKPGKFDAEAWTERLAQALSELARGHENMLRKYYGLASDMGLLFGGPEGGRHTYSPEQVWDHFAMQGRRWDWVPRQAESQPPKASKADVVGSILLAHPALAGVPDSMAGRDEFRVQGLGTGRFNLADGPHRRIDGAGRGAQRRPFPDGCRRVERTPRSDHGNQSRSRIGRPRCRMRHCAVLRPDAGGGERPRRWHGNRSVRAGKGIRGREAGARARPGGNGGARLALGRCDRQAVPMDALVSHAGRPGGWRVEAAGRVFPGRSDLPGTDCRGACGARPSSCRTAPIASISLPASCWGWSVAAPGPIGACRRTDSTGWPTVRDWLGKPWTRQGKPSTT